jgi:hypothetical protein
MSGIDDRRHAPAAQRNRDAILEVLRPVLPHQGLVLEIASGTGEHAAHFARALPGLTWQPSDPSPDALRSITAWVRTEARANLRPPLQIDVTSKTWPIDRADALLCINMIHISPWAATEALMRGASAVLDMHAPLCLYGPYRRAGLPLEPSNAAFDEDLRRRDPSWGLRELGEVTDCAAAHGFERAAVTQMPANNLTVVFRKR